MNKNLRPLTMPNHTANIKKKAHTAMPREDRRIIFEFQETYKALYALCVQREMKKPPPGMVGAVIQHPDDANKVIVRIDNAHSNTQQDIEFSGDFLAAALMLYCRTIRIPLPKSAQKSVEFAPDGVILRVQI
jgi:hypothetical protein